jgi:D-arabinose 1-dehydrogenase-like Zn-dependent alcohol dehydrogenase
MGSHKFGRKAFADNEAYERLLKSDVKYRFSIDMASLKSE